MRKENSMRQILSRALLLALSCNSLSWAESPTPPTIVEKSTSTPAAQTTSLPTPLPADMFQGRVREAYQAAAEIPEVLAGVSCYCGCSKSQGHRNLLDCFATDHGAG